MADAIRASTLVEHSRLSCCIYHHDHSDHDGDVDDNRKRETKKETFFIIICSIINFTNYLSQETYGSEQDEPCVLRPSLYNRGWLKIESLDLPFIKLIRGVIGAQGSPCFERSSLIMRSATGSSS